MYTQVIEKLKLQMERQLPFVAYHKPAAESLHILTQDNDVLHHIHDYTEQGFVMAPYSHSRPAVLIPGIPEATALIVKKKKVVFDTPVFPDDVHEKNAYKKMVAQAITQISAGSLIKVVLSRKQKIPTALRPLTVFEQLVNSYPEAFTYIWYHPKVGLWMGATPETLLSLSGLRFTTMALAGTQKFEGNLKVSWGQKEQEEQRLVVDTIKRQLASLGIKNIKIHDRETLKAGNLLHLKTEIGVLLQAEENLGPLLDLLHPTPAVCGLPRDLAHDFIIKNENYDRSFYTGFLGTINQPAPQRGLRKRRNTENLAYTQFNKTSHLYVNLRCMAFLDKAVEVYAGGGITSGSEPEKEWWETVNKTQVMRRVLG